MKIVIANIKTTTLNAIIASTKEQIDVASSKILHSFSIPKALETPPIREKERRYKNKDIIIGSVIITIAIIAITPHELFT